MPEDASTVDYPQTLGAPFPSRGSSHGPAGRVSLCHQRSEVAHDDAKYISEIRSAQMIRPEQSRAGLTWYVTPRREARINAIAAIFERACPGWGLDHDDRGVIALLLENLPLQDACAAMELAVMAYALTSRAQLERFFAMPTADYYGELLQYFFTLCDERVGRHV